jgi:hypothetical protein
MAQLSLFKETHAGAPRWKYKDVQSSCVHGRSTLVANKLPMTSTTHKEIVVPCYIHISECVLQTQVKNEPNLFFGNLSVAHRSHTEECTSVTSH